MTKIKFTGLFLSLIFLAAACNHQLSWANIGGHKLDLEVAATEAARAQGLSGRDFLAENSGMLFLFETPGQYGFWMKGMKFPLDLIWIRNNKVVDITHNVLIEPGVADDQLRHYLPAKSVDSIIEVNAGWAKKNEIKAGDTVDFNSGKR